MPETFCLQVYNPKRFMHTTEIKTNKGVSYQKDTPLLYHSAVITTTRLCSFTHLFYNIYTHSGIV